MLVLLEKDTLYSTFNVDSFIELESTINTLSPSMTEYYLSDLASVSNDNTTHLNKSNVEKTLFIDSIHSLFLDYNDDIYLEILNSTDNDLYTESLW